GNLTLYGLDTVAHYNQVLQSVTWQEPSTAQPNFNARIFNVRVYDGAARSVAIRNVLFDPGYDPPTPSQLPNPDPYVDLNGVFDANGQPNGLNNTVSYTGSPVILAD